MSNNVAEYSGLIACLRNACSRRPAAAKFEVDSLLLAMQASFQWQCRSSNLLDLYCLVLELLARLDRLNIEVEIADIYREYNATADGWANAVFDSRVSQIRHNW